jgi:two-component system OmpR family response regulator
MAALRLLREAPVDLVVLDINMPNVDGFEVLTRMREAGDQTPVIILTARQDRDDTKTGFELGADDFVKKPFGIEELTLRVKAVLRRAQGAEPQATLRIGAISLDTDQHAVTCNGEIIELSATEFRLLQVLMEDAGRVLSKAQLLRRVWGIDDGLETTVVETYISYLRKKLGPELSIRTVRGVGYQLTGGKGSP